MMDPGPITVPCITIPNEEAEVLFLTIQAELEQMSPEDCEAVYLILTERKAIAISLSAEWRPFLGFTSGYNLPAQRRYLPEGIKVLDHVIDHLSTWNLEFQGGRVFINQDVAQKVIDNQKHTICIWDWQGEDPIKRVGNILRSIGRN